MSIIEIRFHTFKFPLGRLLGHLILLTPECQSLTVFHTFWQFADSGPNPGDADVFQWIRHRFVDDCDRLNFIHHMASREAWFIRLSITFTVPVWMMK